MPVFAGNVYHWWWEDEGAPVFGPTPVRDFRLYWGGNLITWGTNDLSWGSP